MRWTLLACCFILGACRTVTPPARTAVPPATAEIQPAASVNREGGAPQRQAEPAAREVAHPSAPSEPVVVKLEGGAPSPPQGVLQEPPMPLPLSSPAQPGATNPTAALPVSLPLREDLRPNPQLAQPLALPLSGKPSANKVEGGAPRRQTGLAASLDLARAREPVERLASPPIALPPLSAMRQHEGSTVGGSLPLPAAASAPHGVTNAAAQPPVTIPTWVADAQMADAWRESELNRRARTQQEREEQFQQFRRAFYQFLSVNPGE